MSQQKSQIGFFQKFGIKYFTFVINLIIYVTVFQLTKSMQLVLIAIIFIPRLGSFLPDDDIDKQPNANLYNKNFYHMIAPAVSVLQLFVILYYIWIRYDQFSHSYQSLISASLSFAIAASITIDASHQLIHRNQKILKYIGFIGLIPFQFTTYPIQHLYLHHKYVGTPDDDITSPKNQSFMLYYFKSVFSSYRQTFKYSKLFFAFCMILHIGYLFSLYQFALIQYSGNQSMALSKTGFFLALAFVGLFVMESIQYIEHYGLVYRKNNEQKPVLQISSWNTKVNPIYNWTIFRFQRHSDHHMNAYKIYSSLQLNQKMPVYPFTFPEAIPASWFPFIWYKIVDHLVDRVMNSQKITQEDIKRSKNWMTISNINGMIVLLVNFYFSQSFNTLFS